MLVATQRLTKQEERVHGIQHADLRRPQHRDIVYDTNTKKFYIDYRDLETGFHHTAIILSPKQFAERFNCKDVALSAQDENTRFMAGLLATIKEGRTSP